ncbi:hypothetical protein GCM10027456_51270 [Kineosporia babensis]
MGFTTNGRGGRLKLRGRLVGLIGIGEVFDDGRILARHGVASEWVLLRVLL